MSVILWLASLPPSPEGAGGPSSYACVCVRILSAILIMPVYFGVNLLVSCSWILMRHPRRMRIALTQRLQQRCFASVLSLSIAVVITQINRHFRAEVSCMPIIVEGADLKKKNPQSCIWGWSAWSKQVQAGTLSSGTELFSLSKAKKYFMRASEFRSVRCFLSNHSATQWCVQDVILLSAELNQS